MDVLFDEFAVESSGRSGESAECSGDILRISIVTLSYRFMAYRKGHAWVGDERLSPPSTMYMQFIYPSTNFVRSQRHSDLRISNPAVGEHQQ